jgi:hypothetical protein
MANNSAECKKWCIPLVTVILGLIITEQKYGLVLLSILPIGIFYFLDSYYLMLENSFREGFASSAKKISMGKFTKKDLFLLLPEDEKSQYWQKAFTSKATFLVYSGLLILTAVGFILAVI